MGPGYGLAGRRMRLGKDRPRCGGLHRGVQSESESSENSGKVSRTFDRILFLMDGRLSPLARLRAYDLLAYGAGRRAYVLYGRHYVEWQQQFDRCTRRLKREIMAGTPRDWFHQTAVECRDIYALAPPGCELGRDFINAASPRVERQILRAGYRLAKVLNDLFK